MRAASERSARAEAFGESPQLLQARQNFGAIVGPLHPHGKPREHRHRRRSDSSRSTAGRRQPTDRCAPGCRPTGCARRTRPSHSGCRKNGSWGAAQRCPHKCGAPHLGFPVVRGPARPAHKTARHEHQLKAMPRRLKIGPNNYKSAAPAPRAYHQNAVCNRASHSPVLMWRGGPLDSDVIASTMAHSAPSDPGRSLLGIALHAEPRRRGGAMSDQCAVIEHVDGVAVGGDSSCSWLTSARASPRSRHRLGGGP